MKNKKKLIFILCLPVFMLGIIALPVSGQHVKINSGAYFKNNGTAYININNAGLINDGNYTKGTETVTFSGTTASTITGGNTDMYNLAITNTGGITTQLGLLTTRDLTIGSGCIFTIDPSKAVTVSSSITNNAGNSGLILQSDATGTASLIHNTNNIPSTVKRYISGSAEAWHFLASPVVAQSISGTWLPSGTYGNGTGYDLYLWNEPNNCWIYKLNTTSTIDWNTVHSGTNFGVGRGYLYSLQAVNPAREFAGNLNNGTIDYGLTINGTDLSLKGFNLAGNPYPSSVDWQAASGWTRSSLVASGGGYDVWIWNPAASNYGVYNSFTGIGTNSVTRYIAPMQGFFIRAISAGNLSMTNSVRVHDGASDWKNATFNSDLFSVVVQSATDKSYDEVQLLFGYTANQAGAAKLFSHVVSAPSLYFLSDGTNSTVQYLTDSIDNPVIPFMFKPGRDGNYALKCNFDENQFAIALLEDRQTHNIQNLKQEQTYLFTATKTDDANRFALHFRSVNNQSDNELPGMIYSDGTYLIIDLVSVSKETELFVYDVLGRKVFQQNLQGGIQHTLNFKIGSQLLVVCLKNPDGSLCQKLLGGPK